MTLLGDAIKSRKWNYLIFQDRQSQKALVTTYIGCCLSEMYQRKDSTTIEIGLQKWRKMDDLSSSPCLAIIIWCIRQKITIKINLFWLKTGLIMGKLNFFQDCKVSKCQSQTSTKTKTFGLRALAAESIPVIEVCFNLQKKEYIVVHTDIETSRTKIIKSK